MKEKIYDFGVNGQFNIQNMSFETAITMKASFDVWVAGQHKEGLSRLASSHSAINGYEKFDSK